MKGLRTGKSQVTREVFAELGLEVEEIGLQSESEKREEFESGVFGTSNYREESQFAASLTEALGSTRIEKLRSIVSRRSIMLVEDHPVDLFSANTVVQLYDEFRKEESRERLMSFSVPEMVEITFKTIEQGAQMRRLVWSGKMDDHEVRVVQVHESTTGDPADGNCIVEELLGGTWEATDDVAALYVYEKAVLSLAAGSPPGPDVDETGD